METEIRDEKGRFLPGNPGGPGRPRDVFTPLLAKKYQDTASAQEVIDKLHELAAGGNMTAISYIVDRFVGKPRQAVEISGDKEQPVPLVILRASDASTTETR